MKKVILILSIILFVCGCNKIKVKEKLEYEINSQVTISDLVVPDDNITLLEPKELVDTSVLGEHKVIIKYLNKRDVDKYKTVIVKIVDKTKPTIECSDKITIIKGKKLDISDYAKVKDNSKEKIKPTIDGKYDLNKVGDYKVSIIAKDSSGNASNKKITISVKNYSIKTSGYYIYKTKSYWEGLRFKKNNKFQLDVNFCPGSACGGYTEYGTYKVKDAAITINITSYMNETDYGKKKETIKCTIKNDKKVVCGKENFSWAKSFY